MRKATAAAALAVLFTLSSAPAHAATIPSERVTIDVVTVNGSGCKQGTAEVIVSPDNTSFWVIYSDYLAQAGKGAGATDFRKNCQLNLQINVPQGFTYGTEFSEIVWAPCGEKRNLNVNSALRVDKGSSDANTNSFMTMDYTRGEVRTLHHFSWKRC